MARTLYRVRRVYSPADPTADALLVDGDRIAWLGSADDSPAADTTLAFDGALLAPAFVDAHVHATDTGLTLLGLDVSGCDSLGEMLDRVTAAAEGLPADAVLLGHGWDESRWPERRPPTAEELDRAAGGRKAYLSRACMHSAVCTPALIAAAPDLAGRPGYDPSGWQKRAAHHAVRAVARTAVSAAQRQTAQRTMLRRAAALGIAAVHECGGTMEAGEDDFTGLLALPGTEPLPEVYGYWGELGAAAKARELGAVGAGGDLFADGALGSQTAHVSRPYLDSGGSGHGYLTAEQVTAHIVDCTRRGMQGGFHAIGDSAIGTVLAGFAAAVEQVGLERIRVARHRIEHVEILDRNLIRQLVEFGIVASMQPAFDRLWGGTDGMYAIRLGAERSLAANPFGALAGVGVPLAFGSDSPVTPLDPWGTVRAAMFHHNAAHRISVRTAFAAHTRGGWRAVHRDDEGVLVPGAAATFAVWDCPAGIANGLPTLTPDSPLPTCLRTVMRGTVIHEHSEPDT